MKTVRTKSKRSSARKNRKLSAESGAVRDALMTANPWRWSPITVGVARAFDTPIRADRWTDVLDRLELEHLRMAPEAMANARAIALEAALAKAGAS